MKSLKRADIEALKKIMPVLLEEEQRNVIGGYGWLSNFWEKVKDFFSSDSGASWDCVFRSFADCYNNNSNSYINPFGNQISYEEMINDYKSKYGDPSKTGGANIGNFQTYVLQTYGINMWQNTNGSVSGFTSTNLIAFQLDPKSDILHFVRPLGINYDDKGNPISVRCYDSNLGEETVYPVEKLCGLFDLQLPMIDSPINSGYFSGLYYDYNNSSNYA
jgi:hypothetical protein